MTQLFHFNGHFDSQSNMIIESITSKRLSNTMAVLEIGEEMYTDLLAIKRVLAVRPALRFKDFSGNASDITVTWSPSMVTLEDLTLRFRGDGVLELLLGTSSVFTVPGVKGPKDTNIVKIRLKSLYNVYLFEWDGTSYYLNTSSSPEASLTAIASGPHSVFKVFSNDQGSFVYLSRTVGNVETPCDLTDPMIIWRDTVDNYDFITDDKVSKAIANTPFVSR